MNHKLYKCDITGYSIEYIIDTNNIDDVLIGNIECDYKHPRAFFSLLRNSVERLKDEEKINIVKQHVTLDDWNNILKGKTTWKFEFNMNNACQIKCSIDDLLKNMAISLGLD